MKRYAASLPVAVALTLSAPVSAVHAAPSGSSVADDPWSYHAELGLGYDSNVYRTPSDPYVDYARTSLPLVTPDVQSGFFLPLDADIRYLGRQGAGRAGFVARYSLDAGFYPSSGTRDATDYSHTLAAGAELLLGKRGRKDNTLSVLPYVKQHHQTYVDRDDGLPKTTTVTGTDISDRYNYVATGVNARLKVDTTAVPFEIRAEAAQRDYDDPVVVDQYDHQYTAFGGEATIPVARPVDVTLSYDRKTWDYDERRALDLGGNLVTGTTREYVYDIAGASLRSRLSRDWTLYIDYRRTQRQDMYVGYYDFDEDRIGVRLRYSGDPVRLRIAASALDRSYPNAYAFDEPTQPHLEYNTVELDARADYSLNRRWSLWLEGKYWDQDTTDLRYLYDRYQLVAGVRWEG